VEYWKVKGETHHSIFPLFQRDETKELAMGGGRDRKEIWSI
jgi:hypothetical protein